MVTNASGNLRSDGSDLPRSEGLAGVGGYRNAGGNVAVVAFAGERGRCGTRPAWTVKRELVQWVAWGVPVYALFAGARPA